VRYLAIFLLTLVGTFIIDQGIKDIFLAGYDWQSECISLELHFNNGVAFSMLSSLGENLKWVQGLFIAGLAIYILSSNMAKEYPFALGLILGGAVGNLYDRFVNIDGVVDYVYWHCGFDFAVFNYADVVIDIGVVLILISIWSENKKEKKRVDN